MVDVQMGVLYGGKDPFNDEEGKGHMIWLTYLIVIIIGLGVGLLVYKKIFKKFLKGRRQKLSEQGA